MGCRRGSVEVEDACHSSVSGRRPRLCLIIYTVSRGDGSSVHSTALLAAEPYVWEMLLVPAQHTLPRSRTGQLPECPWAARLPP